MQDGCRGQRGWAAQPTRTIGVSVSNSEVKRQLLTYSDLILLNCEAEGGRLEAWENDDRHADVQSEEHGFDKSTYDVSDGLV